MSLSPRMEPWARNYCCFPGPVVPAKAPWALCPALCSCAGICAKIFPGEGQVPPTHCKERGNSPSCSQQESLLRLLRLLLALSAGFRHESPRSHSASCPCPLLEAALAAAVLLWGNIIKVQLPEVWSSGTDLSHVVVI